MTIRENSLTKAIRRELAGAGPDRIRQEIAWAKLGQETCLKMYRAYQTAACRAVDAGTADRCWEGKKAWKLQHGQLGGRELTLGYLLGEVVRDGALARKAG